MRTRQVRKLATTALGLIVLGSLWFYLAPVALGGSTTYVVTDGISMEPRFHTGDLALVHSQSSYHVGEIVAYHNKMLGTIVLHRIVGRSGDRYLFKGDNNNFVDFEHPLASQLVGTLWLHIPGAGADLKSIGSPLLVGILVAVGMLLLSAAAFTRRRRRRRRQRRTGESTEPGPGHWSQLSAEPVVGTVALGLVVLLPFVVLALLAFTRPTTSRRAYEIPYKQSGAFSYSASTAAGPAYADGRAVTGDPLFTHVLDKVDLRFSYLFDTTAKHTLKGRASLAATLASTTSGWHSAMRLGAPAYFHGDRAVVTGTLDLSSLVALMRSVESTTDVSGSSYTLTIVPHVSTSGSLGPVPLDTTFSPTIQFSLSELEAQPVAPASGGSLASAQLPASVFTPSASGSVTGTRYEPLFLSFKFVHVSVASARTIALSGIAIVLFALMTILALMRPRLGDELATIRSRHGRLIVPVARVSQLPGVAVIDVADMDALARIAEHYDRSILHESTAEGDSFWVNDESGSFRYTVGAQASTIEKPIATAVSEGIGACDEDRPLSTTTATANGTIAEPAWTENGQAGERVWTENGHLAEPACTQNGLAGEPAWPQNGQAGEPAWTENRQTDEPARPQNGQVADPVMAADRQVLAPAWSQVYADELDLGEVLTASAAQPAPERSPSDPAGVAWDLAAENGWAGTHDEADTFVLAARDWRTAASADAGRASTAAAVAFITGMEWTTNS